MVSRVLPDTLYLKLYYRFKFHKKLNLKNPQTFNEKLQWLKLHNRKAIYSIMVDKLAAKQYVAQTIGEEHIIPTLGVWDRFDDIDFDSLPNQFVLKCTHDSGGLVICKDKSSFDKKAANKIIDKCLKRNYYWSGREWPYKNVTPRILAEKYMEDIETKELRDYKFFCFNGKVKCFKIDFNRFVDHRANYYSPDGELLRFGEEVCPPDFEAHIELPRRLQEMKKKAEILSLGIPFVRIDFYEVDDRVYFGEMTFFPASGFGAFVPVEWDFKFGEWLTFPTGTGQE